MDSCKILFGFERVLTEIEQKCGNKKWYISSKLKNYDFFEFFNNIVKQISKYISKRYLLNLIDNIVNSIILHFSLKKIKE